MLSKTIKIIILIFFIQNSFLIEPNGSVSVPISNQFSSVLLELAKFETDRYSLISRSPKTTKQVVSTTTSIPKAYHVNIAQNQIMHTMST